MLKSEDVFWTADQITLQQWLALPKRERKPKTLGLLASSLGIEQNTLTRWKQLDGFMDEVRKFIRSELEDDISEIYGALRKEAKAGSFQHIKLALELNGDYVQKIAPTSPDGKEPAKTTGSIDIRLINYRADLGPTTTTE